jgi:hypothetical protein
MKKVILLSGALTGILFSSCKKEYTCECKNPGGVFKTYTIKDTKLKAKNKCADYSKEYQDVAWSETGCSVK